MIKDNDPINPNHYKGILIIPAKLVADYIDKDGNLSLEYIDVMRFTMTHEEFIGHLKGQTWKYMLRLGKKDDSVQELSKSSWYLAYLRRFLTYLKDS